MLGKLLVWLDLVSALLLIFYFAGLVSAAAIKYVALFLLIKGLFFVLTCRDFASFVDTLCGFYLLILSAGVYSSNAITLVVIVWLLQKSVVGLL